MPFLVALVLLAPSQDPAEIRKELEAQIQAAQARLKKLDQAEKTADRKTEGEIRSIEASRRPEEEKKLLIAKARAERDRLVVQTYYAIVPAEPLKEVPEETRTALKAIGEKITRTLRTAEELFKKSEKEGSAAVDLLRTAGWMIARLANSTVDSGMAASKGKLGLLPDDRPVFLASTDLPDPFARAVETVRKVTDRNRSILGQVRALSDGKKGREASALARRLLENNRVCSQRMLRAKMIMDSFVSALTEFDAKVRKALPKIQHGVRAAPTELSKLEKRLMLIHRTLELLDQGLEERAEALRITRRLIK
jgi:hypothetical protein